MLICTRTSWCKKLGGHGGDCDQRPVPRKSEYTPKMDEALSDSEYARETFIMGAAGCCGKCASNAETFWGRWLSEVVREAEARALEQAADWVALMGTSKAVAELRARAAEIRVDHGND